jgi:hypothetical protein
MNMPISLSTPFTRDGQSDSPPDHSGATDAVDFSAFLVVPAAPSQPPAPPLPNPAEQMTIARPADPSIAQPWPQPLQGPISDTEPLWAGFDHAPTKPVDGPIKPEFNTATSKPGGRGTEIFQTDNPANTGPQFPNSEPMGSTRSTYINDTRRFAGTNTIVPGQVSAGIEVMAETALPNGIEPGPQTSTAAPPTELPSIRSTEQSVTDIQDPHPGSRWNNASAVLPADESAQASAAVQTTPLGMGQAPGTTAEHLRPAHPKQTEVHSDYVRHIGLSGTGSTEHLPGSKTDREMTRFSLPRLSSILGEAEVSSPISSELDDSAAGATSQASQIAGPEDGLHKDSLHPAKLTVSDSLAAGPLSQAFAQSVQIASDTVTTVEQDRPTQQVPAGVNVLEQIEPRVLDIVRDLLPGEDANSLKMRLSPAELGSVEITIVRHESGSMSAEFWTENETAQSALNENLAHLRESLEASGVQIESIEIGCRSFSSDTQQGPHGHEVRTEQYSSGTAAPAASFDEEPDGEDRLVDLRA